MIEILYWIGSIILIMIAGIFSGLTLGMLSQDPMNLEILSEAGETERIRKDATKMRWLIEGYYHRLMITLIMGNMFAALSLPVFLDEVVTPLGSILLSVTAILIFGEILPQAICARYGLRIGALLQYPVLILLFLFTPVNYPLGRILDWILGDRSTYYTPHQLRVLMEIHERRVDMIEMVEKKEEVTNTM